MSISLLRQLLMKEAVKKSAGSSGIMTINKNIARDVEQQVQKFVNDALAQGVDLDTLSESQIKYIIAMNKPKAPKVYSNEEAEKYLDMFLNKNKKGDVVDLTGKKLDTSKPIIGGTQDETGTSIMDQINDRMANINKASKRLQELMDERDLMYGKAPKTKNNPKVQEREMFSEANERFNKTDIVADSVARITSMEPVAAMKEANKIIKREGIYKNLNKEQSQAILKGTDDWINQRDPSDLYDYNKNRPFRDDPDFDPDDPDYQEFLKNRNRDDYYTGGMVDVEPNLSDIGHGSDALMARTRLMSPGAQATTSTGLNYLLAEDNDNIRVPFAGGESARYENYYIDPKTGELKKKPKLEPKAEPYFKYDIDEEGNLVPKPKIKPQPAAEGGRIGFSGGGMGRRAFLKLLAALTGGVAAAKSGILSLGGKEVGKKAVTETIKKSAGSGQPPPYFFKLVEKIRFMGDDTLASKDKAIAKKYKDYYMEEDFAGNIEIIKRSSDDMYPEDVYMRYTVDDVALKDKKGFAKVDEYEEYTARPDMEGKMKDVEPGVPDEVVQEGTMFEDTMTEFGKTKKADGGRIGFSAGSLARLGITGSSRRFLEKVFGKETFENMIENDPELHRGMLEVVEMFRNRDKEGLKMYMQKFLPHMDDEMIEDFIVGSGGTEGIEGQLIRLGSGRDYKGKIEMIEEADRVRKLNALDVSKMKPNADGGRIGLFLGGGLTIGKGQLRQLLQFMAKGSSHGKTPAEMLQMVNPKQFNKMLNDPATMGKVSAEAPEGIPGLIKEYTEKMKMDRSNMIRDLIGTGRKIKKVDDDIVTYKIKIVEDMVSKGVDRRTAEEMAETMAQMVSQQAGKKATPKITEQGLLEMENIQKNLLTKDRKLQARGGLTTMLGE